MLHTFIPGHHIPIKQTKKIKIKGALQHKYAVQFKSSQTITLTIIAQCQINVEHSFFFFFFFFSVSKILITFGVETNATNHRNNRIVVGVLFFVCVVSAEIAINSCTMYVQLLIKKTFNFIPENWNSSDDKIDKIHLRAFIKSLFSNRNNFITFILILNCSYVVCILCCLVCDVRCTVYGVWCMVCVCVSLSRTDYFNGCFGAVVALFKRAYT